MEITAKTCVCGSDRDDLAGKLRMAIEALKGATEMLENVVDKGEMPDEDNLMAHINTLRIIENPTTK